MLVKKLWILGVLALICFGGNAQSMEALEVPLSNPDEPGQLKISIVNGSIEVEGYSGKTVIIEADKRGGQRSRPKTKNGLKRLSSGKLDISVEERDNTVRISAFPSGSTDFKIKVPRKFSLKLGTVNSGKIKVHNVEGDIEASNTNGAITMTDISGSVVADALNQNITVSFTGVNGKPMAFSGLNGDIDLTFPASFKGTIKANSEFGEVFTDFDMKLKVAEQPVKRRNSNGVYKVKREGWIYGDINGGGPEIRFKTLNGDILIRKK
jgi:DUF4097 and DUF4098 domain-containing protein YvlB